MLAPLKKSYDQTRQRIKKQRHYFANKDPYKDMVFPVVTYWCKNWTIKKAEHQRIDAFELWCWRRLLRVPWTVRRSNQSILKEINSEYLSFPLSSTILFTLSSRPFWFAQTYTLLMGLRAQASSVFSSPSTSSQQRLLLPPQNSRRGCGQDAGGDGVQSLNHVWLFANPWTAARQASLSFTISWSLLKLMSIEWMMPSNNLILCCPLLLLPSVFPSIRVFPNESALPIRWPKCLLDLQYQSLQWISKVDFL